MGALLAACGGTAAVSAPSSAVPSTAPPSAPASVSAKPVAGVASSAPASAANAAAKPSVSAAPAVGGKLKLPTYVRFPGPSPDLAGTADGVNDAYFAYPKTMVKSVQTPPGKGGDVTIQTSTVNVPIPLDQSKAWQQINKELNVNLKWNLATTAGDSRQKVAAAIAANDIPDVLFLGHSTNVAFQGLPQFVSADCADLTPYLSGDAIKDFPNLASLPTYLWQAPFMSFAGKLYGLPTAISRIGDTLEVHQEVLDEVGFGQIKTADDFKKALQAVSKPGARFGIGDLNNFQHSRYFGASVFGAPNNWGLDKSGKLMKDIETDQFKAGLAWLHDLWAAGLFHPDSLTFTNVTVADAFATAKFVFYWASEDTGGSGAWTRTLQANPNAKLAYVAPFSSDGVAKPIRYLSTGNFGVTLLKKGTPDRVKEVLGVMNYIAAPFGTAEKMLTTNGVEGVDYTFDKDGNPQPIDAKSYAKQPLSFQYVTQSPPVIYTALRSKDFATLTYNSEKDAIAAGLDDPTSPYYSPSDGSIGATLQPAIDDAIGSIVTGREPMSFWDQTVKDWQTKGGNKIRDEYQAAIAAAS
ncbi:MAG: hypothetical protein JO247_15265 [Chloroflexi bacterium]|nr:hypothetical protein [Chloroflexota bacterium]